MAVDQADFTRALTALRRVATIESIGSSTRIEGANLSDREVEARTGYSRYSIPGA
ncbi:MAG: hypothetical protein L0H83_08610 [Salinisphaera sp.]|nr:hypothetical protein [Salinisphaera sp.]